MRGLLLYVANMVSSILPQTRAFTLRRWFFRLAGADISQGAKVVGFTRIYYPNVSIGASWIGAGTQLSSTPNARISIGDRCDIAPGVLLVVGSHEIGTSHRRAGKGNSLPITVGSGTWIGARATILGGSRIGEGSIIAAGAVVRGEFPPNVLIAGVPARVVRSLD